MVYIATLKDLDGINSVRSAHPGVFYKTDYDLDLRDIEQSENSVTFVDRVNEQIIGYLVLHTYGEYDLFQSDKDTTFEILVLEEYQGQKKCGPALMEKAIQFIKNETKSKRLKALVKNANKPMRKLCEKFHFKPEDKFKNGPDDNPADIGKVWFLNIKR